MTPRQKSPDRTTRSGTTPPLFHGAGKWITALITTGAALAALLVNAQNLGLGAWLGAHGLGFADYVVSRVVVTPRVDTLYAIGDTLPLMAAVTDRRGAAVVGSSLLWHTEDSSVATVDSGGTVVASPDFTAETAGTVSFADAQSNTWTLSGTAEISDRRYRAHTEVPAWPPQWDPTGADVYAPIEAAGRWRRLTSGTPPQASAMYRAYVRLTGDAAPVAYWPCEDGSDAASLASALGGTAMAFSGSPSLASDSSFLSSKPLPTVSGSKWTGIVPPYTAPSAAANILRFLMKIPSSSPPPTGAIIASLYTYGTVARTDLIYSGSSQIDLKGYDTSGSLLLDTGASSTVISPDCAVRLGVKPGDTGKGVAQVVGGAVIATGVVKVGYIKAGPRARTGLNIAIVPHKGPPFAFDGLLGMDFLRGLTYRIDFQRSLIIWSD